MVKDEKLIAKRRRQMVKAAVRLFIEKGFHRTTTREIAREAGFSIGTLYEYIRKKEDILYLVCDSIYDEVRRRIEETLSVENGSVAALRRAILKYFQVVDDMQDEVLVMYQEARSLSQEALPYVLQKELEMTAMFEKLLWKSALSGELALKKEDISLAAHNLMVAGQMWTFRRWALRKMYDVKTYAEHQFRLLLENFTKPQADGHTGQQDG